MVTTRGNIILAVEGVCCQRHVDGHGGLLETFRPHATSNVFWKSLGIVEDFIFCGSSGKGDLNVPP